MAFHFSRTEYKDGGMDSENEYLFLIFGIRANIPVCFCVIYYSHNDIVDDHQ